MEGNKSEKEWVAGAAGAMGGGEQVSELIRRRERLASQPASDIMGCADLQQRRMNTHRDQPRTSLMHAHAPFNRLLDGVEGTVANADQTTAAVGDSARF